MASSALSCLFSVVWLLYLRNTRGNEANKDEVFTTAVHELVLFIAWDENHRAAGDFPPFSVLVDLSFSGMDKYFVLPVMGMSGGESAWNDGKHTHTKVIGRIFLADYDSAGDTFYSLVVKFMGRGILVVRNFHDSLFAKNHWGKTDNDLPLQII